MKKSFKFMLAICLMFVINYTQAQIKFGPKVGLNLSTMTMKASGISVDPITMAGFNIGVVSEIPLDNNFVLQPGLMYSTKGSKYEVSGSKMSISPTYIEMPINAMCKYSLGTKNLLAFAGPYLGVGFGGGYETPLGNDDINYGTGSYDDLRLVDFGLNIGAGIETGAFQITAQYGFSLTNLAPVTTNDEEAKNRVFGISVAYMLGGK